MTYISEKLTNRSGATITVTINDEDGNAISAGYITNLKWSLYDADGNVINSRSDVTITPIANPVDIDLTEDDTDNADGLKRELVLTFDADTSLGDDIAQEQTVIFEIEGDADESIIIDVENNLVTLNELKAYLDISTTDTDYDDRLERVINAVSTNFNNATNRLLKARNITEYKDSDGSDTIRLDQFPINSTAATISIYNCSHTPRDYTADEKASSDDILIYPLLGKVRLITSAFYEGYQTVKVVYNGGYTEIPFDLKQACLMICGRLWKREKDKLDGVQNVAVQGSSMSSDISDLYSGFVLETLEKYRRYAL